MNFLPVIRRRQHQRHQFDWCGIRAYELISYTKTNQKLSTSTSSFQSSSIFTNKLLTVLLPFTTWRGQQRNQLFGNVYSRSMNFVLGFVFCSFLYMYIYNTWEFIIFFSMYFYFNKHFCCIVYCSIVTHLAARTTTQSAVRQCSRYAGDELRFGACVFVYLWICMYVTLKNKYYSLLSLVCSFILTNVSLAMLTRRQSLTFLAPPLCTWQCYTRSRPRLSTVPHFVHSSHWVPPSARTLSSN